MGQGKRESFLFAHGAPARRWIAVPAAIAEGVSAAGVRVIRFDSVLQRAPETARWNARSATYTCSRSSTRIGKAGGVSGLGIAGKSRAQDRGMSPTTRRCARGVLGIRLQSREAPRKRGTAHLENLHTPTLILQGPRDIFAAPHDPLLQAKSPGNTIEWIEDGRSLCQAARTQAGRT